MRRRSHARAVACPGHPAGRSCMHSAARAPTLPNPAHHHGLPTYPPAPAHPSPPPQCPCACPARQDVELEIQVLPASMDKASGGSRPLGGQAGSRSPVGLRPVLQPISGWSAVAASAGLAASPLRAGLDPQLHRGPAQGHADLLGAVDPSHASVFSATGVALCCPAPEGKGPVAIRQYTSTTESMSAHAMRPDRGPQVGVENAKLRGRIRVTMRPLLRRVPVVGAVQVGGRVGGPAGPAARAGRHLPLVSQPPRPRPIRRIVALALQRLEPFNASRQALAGVAGGAARVRL